MVDLVEVTLHELLRYRRAPAAATSVFKSLKHNDALCPKIAAQLCDFLEGSRRYRNVAYDVQGLRDRGKDIVLRYGEDTDNLAFITFQIKSYDDLSEDGYLRTLKAQTFEVREDYGDELRHHFILLCTDIREHHDRIRNVCAEFAKAEWATVIEPQYALTFMRLSSMRIDAVTQSILREDDAVHKAAATMIANLAPFDVALLLSLLSCARAGGSHSVRMSDLMSSGFLNDALQYIPDIPRDGFFFSTADGDEIPDFESLDRDRSSVERVSEALEAMGGAVVDLDPVSETIFVDPSQSLPIEALMIDAQVRFGLDGDAVARFVFDTLDVARTFELDFDLFEA